MLKLKKQYDRKTGVPRKTCLNQFQQKQCPQTGLTKDFHSIFKRFSY